MFHKPGAQPGRLSRNFADQKPRGAVRQGNPTKLPQLVVSAGLTPHTNCLTPQRRGAGASLPPYLLDKRLLEKGDEWVGPWNVDVDLENSTGSMHQPYP